MHAQASVASIHRYAAGNSGEVPWQDVQEQVRRILASRIFSRSARLTRFVSFVMQHALHTNGESLKEYVLGVEVFDRPSAYDPRIDPIVRVEARRLRSKLASYYASVGRADPVIVEIPKGTYTPVFRRQSCPTPIVRELRNSVPAFAVLPFEPLTTIDPAGGFAAGLTEEIVHRLASLREVRLLSSQPGIESSQGTRKLDDQEQLNVLLRGSVRSNANRFRIIAQCIDVSSRIYIWSEAYDRDGQNILSLQNGIAKSIVAGIRNAMLTQPGTAEFSEALWRRPL